MLIVLLKVVTLLIMPIYFELICANFSLAVLKKVHERACCYSDVTRHRYCYAFPVLQVAKFRSHGAIWQMTL